MNRYNAKLLDGALELLTEAFTTLTAIKTEYTNGGHNCNVSEVKKILQRIENKFDGLSYKTVLS